MGARILFFLILVSLFGSVSSVVYTGSVYYNATANNSVTFVHDLYDQTALSYGEFNDSLVAVGWGYLSVSSQNTEKDAGSRTSDFLQAYALGYLEGYLTHDRIFENFNVTLEGWKAEYGGEIPTVINDWFTENINFIDSQIAESNLDSYWYNVKIVRRQFQGLVDAYNEIFKEQPLTFLEIWLIQSMGDLEDVSGALNVSAVDKALRDYPHHCSGYVKLLTSLEDVFFAQDTWSAFSTMNRILKEYRTGYEHASILSQQVAFSSYAGILFSVDDFYITEAGLAVLETTFNIFNSSLYDEFLTSSTVLTWMRVQVTNRIASSGPEWSDGITKYNSGTYNNQWVVMDNKLFTPGEIPPDNFLYVVELIPGHVWSGDGTERLRKDMFYPSINAPSDEHLFNVSGYEMMVESVGDYWSYWKCSRMLIMQRNTSEIETFEHFKSFMRYNHYQTDPLSNGDPAQAIASRYDLRTVRSFPFGAIDTKATNTRLMRDLSFHAHSGPPGIETGLPTFSFTEAPLGLPKTWNYTFEQYTPKTSIDMCGVQTSCGSCVASPSCGWCNSGSCLRGDSFSPYSSDCVGDWSFSSCPVSPSTGIWTIIALTVGTVLACCLVVVVVAIVFFGGKTAKTQLAKLIFKRPTPKGGAEYENLDDV